MVFGLLRRWRRKRLVARGFPGSWAPHLEALPFVHELTDAQRTRLEKLTLLLIDQVHWEGAAGLEVTDAMRVSVAAQACRLALGLGDFAFDRVRTIYLFPSTYNAPAGGGDVPGSESAGRSHRHGEAWLRGPIVLSWDASKNGVADSDDGHNVVYHEFAHKLDMLDGYADGTPPARSRAAFERWNEVAEREYELLSKAAQRRKRTLLDPYGATNPAEFFAVATELFFERPQRMRDKHGDLYRCLVDFYGQDPAVE